RAEVQGLYATHLQRLIDSGAGLPKPGLETVPGEVESVPSDVEPASEVSRTASQLTGATEGTARQHDTKATPVRSTQFQRQTLAARRHILFDAALRAVVPGKLIDLGAGHGGYSRRAADAGWKVTAVDARDIRFPNDDRITWVRQDIRECDL